MARVSGYLLTSPGPTGVTVLGIRGRDGQQSHPAAPLGLQDGSCRLGVGG
jgi:hypothetical protein